MSHLRRTVLLCFAAVLTACSTAATAHTNFVFFLVDDLGWADVGCFGSTFYETPNIDALCASGMKFTNGYAACPVCSPTRASIMTGRHPVRVDITDWIPGRATPEGSKFLHVNDRDNLALEEVTIAEALKKNGYKTFFAGKWHLGEKGHWPTDQGFDINIGGMEKGSPPGGYYAPWKNPNLKSKSDEEYLTERLTEESLAFMESAKDDPFLLFFSYYNVHTPITPYKKRLKQFRDKYHNTIQRPADPLAERDAKSRGSQDNFQYASMVAAVDDSVGLVMRKLESLQLADNTVVVFFSDNGGLCTLGKRAGPTCNLPLRSGKGWLYEGGVREPTIIRAPGVTKPGSESDVPVVSMDFFPTILELAGMEPQPERHQDGVSLVPLLRGESIAERSLYWHYPHYHGSNWRPGASIRDGDWKLIEFYDWGETEVYNLADDPGEQKDLGQSNPAKRQELQEKLIAWQTKMQARMPEQNPAYDESVAR